MSAIELPARLDDLMRRLFGSPDDPIRTVEARAREAFAGVPIVVWEGDPTTFQFSFVSDGAEALLGHPVTRWTNEPTFWVDHVVHALDRDDAVAYCALATGKGCDHTFEYRAVRADGSIVWLRDIVRVILGPRRVPQTLRGIMFDVSAEKQAASFPGRELRQQEPSVPELHAMT